MLAPESARDGLLALYAFNLEVARAPWASTEELVAEMRLQWWIDAVADLQVGKLRSHPVLEALSNLHTSQPVSLDLLGEMAQARRFDIYRDGHADRASFDVYINATSGNLLVLTAALLGPVPENTLRNYAYAGGVARLWRALPELYARGRHPVPLDCALDRNAVAEGAVPDTLARSLQDISTGALERLTAARKARASVPRKMRLAMLAEVQPDLPLKTARRSPEILFTQPPQSSLFRTHTSLFWRAISGRY